MLATLGLISAHREPFCRAFVLCLLRDDPWLLVSLLSLCGFDMVLNKLMQVRKCEDIIIMDSIKDEDRKRRLRKLEETIQDPRSIANVDCLL
ncbi:hypothetical protein L9F63_017042, partial [Diploptera punctata]